MTFDEQDSTLFCRFEGELNTEVCSRLEPELNARITTFLNDHDAGNLAFDLKAVRYISSAFLRICLVYCKQAGNKHFRIEGATDEIMKIFQIAGFTEMMNVS